MGGRTSRQRCSLGDDPNRPEGMAMSLIRCKTGNNIEVEGPTLVGANLSGLDLHRALLEGGDLRQANLAGANLRSAWLERATLDEATVVDG